ncbi:hypothetical protein Hsero_1623 [Herbaspirillum seropedicae SmR1]|uniref:Uncharacterized protein n=1 Tax=Herbaspirillum seropedicae (strain SmR1) TaxID=757424 RepID=D8IQM5_HERSS|nr:hypothetical protein Hsero_1623 [Herbaspirillum seropedicae SmR1]
MLLRRNKDSIDRMKTKQFCQPTIIAKRLWHMLAAHLARRVVREGKPAGACIKVSYALSTA